MQSISNATFGPLIAYLVPGLTVLAGLSPYSPTLKSWLSVAHSDAPTIGGFLYLTIASLAAGMIVSALRWACIDPLHAFTGVRPPSLDFGLLPSRTEAFSLLIEIHYRHYQFYSNMLVASAIAYTAYKLPLAIAFRPDWSHAIFIAFETVFFLTSRDTLRKYYHRSQQLLGTSRPTP